MPPVIKGEEAAAEGEGRACGAEPPPETARHREEREAAWLAPPSSSLPPFHGLSCRVAAAAFLPSLFRLSNTQNDSAPWLPLTGMSLPGLACRCRPAVRQSS